MSDLVGWLFWQSVLIQSFTIALVMVPICCTFSQDTSVILIYFSPQSFALLDPTSVLLLLEHCLSWDNSCAFVYNIVLYFSNPNTFPVDHQDPPQGVELLTCNYHVQYEYVNQLIRNVSDFMRWKHIRVSMGQPTWWLVQMMIIQESICVAPDKLSATQMRRSRARRINWVLGDP